MRLPAKAAASLTLLTSTLLVAPVNDAAAATVDLSCSGTETTKYSPGLTFTTRNTELQGDDELVTCRSSDPTITSGTGTFKGQGDMNCLNGQATGSFVFRWSNGNRSWVSFATTVVTRIAGNMVLATTGEVTDGQFQGDTLTNTVTLVNDEVTPTQCLTPEGVQTASGPVTVTLTNP